MSSDFEGYRRDIFDFDYFDQRAKEGFEERIGPPTEIHAIVGLIHCIQSARPKAGGIHHAAPFCKRTYWKYIITSELSFNNKLNLFASLATELRDTRYSSRLDGEGFKDKYLREFVKALSKCEELRNKVTHSNFAFDISESRARIVRQKITAKARHGLRVTTEHVEISHLMNIYDFTRSMEMEILEFMSDFEKRD
jgi:hypothetical protein